MNSQEDQKEKQERLDEENRYTEYLKECSIPHAKGVAEAFEKGELHPSALRTAYQLTQNSKRAKKTPYQNFLYALANNKLSKKGKHAHRYIQALNSGSQEEKQYTQNLFSKLSSRNSATLSELEEKNHLKVLHDLQLQTQENSAHERAESEAIAASTSKHLGSQIEAITANLDERNWKPEKPDEALLNRLDQYSLKHYQLAGESNKLAHQLEQAKAQTPVDEQLTSQLTEKINQLDDEIDALREAAEADEQKYVEWLQLMDGRRYAIAKLAERTGIDLFFAKELKYPIEDGVYESLKIEKIEFADADLEGTYVSPDALLIGDLTITVSDSSGVSCPYSAIGFERMVKNLQAREPVEAHEIVEDEDVTIEGLQARLDRDAQKEANRAAVLGSVTGKKNPAFPIESFNKSIKLPTKVGGTTPVQIFDPDTNRYYPGEIQHGENGKITTSYAKGPRVAGPRNPAMPYVHIPGVTPPPPKFEDPPPLDANGKPQYRIVKKSGLSDARNFAEAAEKNEIKADDTITAVADSDKSDAKTAETSSSTTGEDEDPKPEYSATAVPYDVIHKVGNMETPPQSGFISNLISETHFMSIDDFWEMGKTMVEYYKRRADRRQKSRYSSLGKNLPFFAPEMARINQNEENSQVSDFQSTLEQDSIVSIYETLETTKNPDEFKAAINVLCEKGQMRWDNIAFWVNINRFAAKGYEIPIPKNGDSSTQIGPHDPRTGLDFVGPALDSIWGHGGYNSWYSQNKSAYTSGVAGFEEKGSELESMQNGHERELTRLLQRHKDGEYVDPHEYEGLIRHAIKNGKSSTQVKIYYLVQGVGYVNKNGRTLMSVDRMGHFNSEFLNVFPVLDYFTAAMQREGAPLGKDGKPIDGPKLGFEDFHKWAKEFDGSSPHSNASPTEAVDRFLWDHALQSSQTQTRLNKGARMIDNMDHDDTPFFIPLSDETTIRTITGSQAGNRKYLSVEGYKNVFVGYSQYVKATSRMNNAQGLINTLRGYVLYQGILNNQCEKDNNGYFHLTPGATDRGAVASSVPLKVFIEENNKLIQNVIDEYGKTQAGNPEYTKLVDAAGLIFGPGTGDLSDRTEKEKQNKIEYAFKQFGSAFENVVKTDGGAKLLEVAQSAQITGM